MEFNLYRLIALIKRDFIIYKKPILYGIAALIISAAIFILSYGDLGYVMEGQQKLRVPYPITYFILIIALIFTSVNFWEFKTHNGRHQFLGLPASHLEKIISHLLYTFIFLGILLIIYRFSFWLTCVLLQFTSDATCQSFSLFVSANESRYVIRSWLPIHALVFLCSIIYNRYAPVKTILTGIGLSLTVALIGLLLIRIIFADYFTGFFDPTEFNSSRQPAKEFQDFAEFTIFPTARFVLFYIVPPFLWIVAYFKLKEKQA